MINKKIRIVIIMGLAILLIIPAYSSYSNSALNNKSFALSNLPINYLHGDFFIDRNEPRAVVGSADYYFVARIESLVNTEYRNPVTLETGNGFKKVSTPYTNYKITVLHNIKGNLDQDVQIPITKAGGIAENGDSIVLFEDDALPEVGKNYVISAYTQQDGTLLISGPNSIELVPENSLTRSNMRENADYLKYQNYYEQEINIERQRFSSIYENE